MPPALQGLSEPVVEPRGADPARQLAQFVDRIGQRADRGVELGRLGGLWIGLPLGVAAIVLGLRARRAGVGVRMATAAIVLAGLAIAQMVVYSAVSAFS